MKLDFSELDYEDLCLICYQARNATFDDITVIHPRCEDFEIFIWVLHAWFPEMTIYVVDEGDELFVGEDTEDLITWR